MTGRTGQRLGAAARESVSLKLWKHGAQALRPSPDQPASIEPAAQVADLAVVRRIVTGSRLAGPVWRLVADASHSWGDSAAVGNIAARWQRFDALPLPQRVRAAGIALVTASVSDGLMSLADRRPVSDYRWLMWGVLVAAGILIAACAAGIGAAWPESRLAGRRR
jgi:hypothetical protein